MKLTGLFKRGAACLCTAAILMGGVSAFALSPALPDEPAPAELSVTNAVSEAQLRSALSKFTVTYDSEAEGWQIDSPYEEASMEKASCGLHFRAQRNPAGLRWKMRADRRRHRLLPLRQSRSGPSDQSFG